MTEPIDLDALAAKWLQQCGACDAGIGECTHPDDDYRTAMLSLVREVERLRRGLERIENRLQMTLEVNELWDGS